MPTFDPLATGQAHRGENPHPLIELGIFERFSEHGGRVLLAAAKRQRHFDRPQVNCFQWPTPRVSPGILHRRMKSFRQDGPVLRRAVVVFAGRYVATAPGSIDLKNAGVVLLPHSTRSAHKIGAHFAAPVVTHRVRGVRMKPKLAACHPKN